MRQVCWGIVVRFDVIAQPQSPTQLTSVQLFKGVQISRDVLSSGGCVITVQSGMCEVWISMNVSAKTMSSLVIMICGQVAMLFSCNAAYLQEFVWQQLIIQDPSNIKISNGYENINRNMFSQLGKIVEQEDRR